MTNTLQILHSLVREFKRCIPESRHYLGKLPESFTAPCFLYLPVFQKESRVSYFFKETTLEIQIVYMGLEDGYNGQDFEEKIEKAARLKPFLDGFLLPVEDRMLAFSYELAEADGHLAIQLSFKFRDKAVAREFSAAQSRPVIENITLNKEEVTNGTAKHTD